MEDLTNNAIATAATTSPTEVASTNIPAEYVAEVESDADEASSAGAGEDAVAEAEAEAEAPRAEVNIAEEAERVAREVEPPLPYELELFHQSRLAFELVGTCEGSMCTDGSCDACTAPARHVQAFYQQPFKAVMMRRPALFAQYYPSLPEVLSYIMVVAGYGLVMERKDKICNNENKDIYSFAPNWQEWLTVMLPARVLASMIIYETSDSHHALLENASTRSELLFEMERVIEFRASVMAATSLAFKVCKRATDFASEEVVDAIMHSANQRVAAMRMEPVLEIHVYDELYRMIPPKVVEWHRACNENHETHRLALLTMIAENEAAAMKAIADAEASGSTEVLPYVDFVALRKYMQLGLPEPEVTQPPADRKVSAPATAYLAELHAPVLNEAATAAFSSLPTIKETDEAAGRPAPEPEQPTSDELNAKFAAYYARRANGYAADDAGEAAAEATPEPLPLPEPMTAVELNASFAASYVRSVNAKYAEGEEEKSSE